MSLWIILLCCLLRFTQAQGWRPDKPAELVIGAAPGGANVFYTIFGPRGMDAAQLAFWDDALSSAMKSDAVKKDLDFNFWTVDIIGHRDLPAFLEKELDAYRRTLLALGMAK